MNGLRPWFHQTAVVMRFVKNKRICLEKLLAKELWNIVSHQLGSWPLVRTK